MLSGVIEEKYRQLTGLIRHLGSVVVAYSGGVDSSLLAVVCRQVLGERSRAVTAQSETYPAHELTESQQVARQFGLNQRIIRTAELNNPAFSGNPANRCYYCKQELFKKLRVIADKEDIAWVVDGTTLSDADDYRPGRQAALELGVRSPLLEVGLRKEEVRRISQWLGLPTWEKPAYACLASRFPYGTAITNEKLDTVRQAEDFLRTIGLRVLRVRYHETISRIEVAPEEIPRLFDPAVRQRISDKFHSLGFLYVTVDLEGYRSGSMNKQLAQSAEGRVAVLDAPENEVALYMACPHCRDKKLETMLTKETRFNQCPECGGVWFGLNELERAIGKKVKFTVPQNGKNTYVSQVLKPTCPVCQAQMVRIKSIEEPELEIDACLVCQGRWVDGAEIAKFQERGLFKQIKNFIMNLF